MKAHLKLLPLLPLLLLPSQLAAEQPVTSLLRVMGLAREGRVMSIGTLEARVNVGLAKQDVRCESPNPCPSLWGARDKAFVIRLLPTSNDQYRVAGGDFDIANPGGRELAEMAEVVAIAAGVSMDEVEALLERLKGGGTGGADITGRNSQTRGWLEMEALRTPRHTLRVHFEFEDERETQGLKDKKGLGGQVLNIKVTP